MTSWACAHYASSARSNTCSERRQGPPSSEDANLVLLAHEPGVLNFRFSHLWAHITPDHWVYPQGVRGEVPVS